MRCSRPAVPGTAHGRASVSGSRRYGWKVPPSAAAFGTAMLWSDARSGIGQGSEPVARNASER